MFAHRKELFIALTIVLVSCVDSDDSSVTEVPNPPSIDTVISTDQDELSALSDSVLFVDQDEDMNCDAHFKSAMNLPKPERLIILHCEYWSSEHPVWLEHSFSFEIEGDDAFFDELIKHNGMIEHTSLESITARQKEWFLPKEAKNYIGFHAEDDFDDFEIFKDLKSGHIFIRGSQY